MTRDDIIRMAREAGYCHAEASDLDFKRLSRFAALVLKTERLAITEAIKEEMTDELEDEAYHLCMELIAKILKRGQT
jgi:hypothetical protein